MLALFYVALVLFTLLFLFLGFTQHSFAFTYLGMALFLFVGIMLLSEGVEIATGAELDPNNANRVNSVFTTFTQANNWIVSALGNIFFYGGLGLIVGTTFFALKHED